MNDSLSTEPPDRFEPGPPQPLPAAQDPWRELFTNEEIADEESLTRAVAAIHLAQLPSPIEPMPEGLKQRILDQVVLDTTTPVSESSLVRASEIPRRTWNPWPWLGWIFAASLVLGLLRNGFPTNPSPEDPVVLKQLDSQPGTRFASGLPLPNETATGMVVWNPDKQKGYLLLDGLPQLEGRQLQLWIFDGERDERYPVDGGVFDSRPGNQMIPIQAKLPVKKATQFAITVEPPGGVVVSQRERIVFLAKF